MPEVYCPHCGKVVSFSGYKPTKCQFCGRNLVEEVKKVRDSSDFLDTAIGIGVMNNLFSHNDPPSSPDPSPSYESPSSSDFSSGGGDSGGGGSSDSF